MLALGCAAALICAGCGDAFQSKESRQAIAQIRRQVEADPTAVDRPTASGELPLVVAMRTNSESLATWLIARGASATARDAQGVTVLHAAVIADRPTFVVLRKLLAERGVDVNVANPRGSTPLHLAAQLAQTEAIDLLLRAGADPRRGDEYGRTPLHVLGDLLLPPDPRLPASDARSAAGQPAAVEAAMARLLEAGASLDARDRQDKRPLHAYAIAGSAAALEAAVAKGAAIDPVDVSGRTPLFDAAALGQVDMVRRLLAHGADVQRRDADGRTVVDALHAMAPLVVPGGAEIEQLLRAAGGRASAEQLQVERTLAESAPSPAPAPEPAPASIGRPVATLRGDLLVADGYIDSPTLRRFVARFATPPAVALCADHDRLIAATPSMRITQCSAPDCPGGTCTGARCAGQGPRDMQSREIAIDAGFATCRAIAFFRDVPGLEVNRDVAPARELAGATSDSSLVPWRFEYRGHEYALRVIDATSPRPASGAAPMAHVLLLRDGRPAATLLEFPAGDSLECATRPWLGDLNGDAEVDVIFGCSHNTYERWVGVSLSDRTATTGRRLLLQDDTGGAV